MSFALQSAAEGKRGRPYARGETPKRYFRMTDDELAWIQAAAETVGQSVSEFTGETLPRRAKRVVDLRND